MPKPDSKASEKRIAVPDGPTDAGVPRARGHATGRRTFSDEQKRAILAEADLCSMRGDMGALLRKYGIYSSALRKWRKALGEGKALRGAGRPVEHCEKTKRIAELERDKAALEARVNQMERLMEFQKKALSLLDAATTLGTL